MSPRQCECHVCEASTAVGVLSFDVPEAQKFDFAKACMRRALMALVKGQKCLESALFA